jgi:peptide/nickel transport system substrate-binding protein
MASLLVATGALLAACSSLGPAPQADNGRPTSGGPPKSITVGILEEPKGFGPFVSHTSGGGAHQVGDIVQQFLAGIDGRSQAVPRLAMELPSVQAGTWRLRPDGTMEQTWRIRPGASWHDGAPVVADDFVFGWEVATDPSMPITRTVPVRFISRAATLDDGALLLEWSQTYPFADVLARNTLEPVPRGRLGDLHRAGVDRFVNAEAWRDQFIGTGPFRIGTWVPGSHIEFRAFEGYFLGRPRLDTVIVRFLRDPNTLLANIISEAIDVALPAAIDVEAAASLQAGWAAPGTGNQVFIYPDNRLRFLEVQMRPELQRPSALAEPRVREAIYRATDRAALVAVVGRGLTQMADSWILPDDPRRGREFRGVIPDRSYDPAAAQRLLADLGWRRGTDGILLDQAGERFEVEVRSTAGGGSDVEVALAAQWLQSIGMQATQYLIPAPLLSDREFRARFPGVSFSSLTVTPLFENDRLRSRGPTRTEPLGTPRNGYNDPRVNDVVDRLQVTVGAADRTDLQRQVLETVLRDLPILPLSWDVDELVVRRGVRNVQGRSGMNVLFPLDTWNVHEWDRD